MMKQLKLILVDDNEKFREALRILAVYKYHADIIAEASSADEVLKLTNLHSADIILMDVMMPKMTGIELTRELLHHHDSNLKIIGVTMHVDKVYLTSLIEAGFKGCIFKNEIINQLGKALLSVMDNQFFFPDDIPLSKNEIITHN